MSVYGELDPMVEHRTQFAFKGKREHIAKVNIPNIASQVNTMTLIYHMVQEIMSLYQILLKLRLILILNQQIRHVVL